jgi:putative ABC transport system substrate-binding protein
MGLGRWGEGRNERYAEIAAEFVALKVDAIVTAGTPPVVAAKRVTSVIPIVSAAMGDPVAAGLVASLARPGGNVTGLSNQTRDVVGKRLEILREVMPAMGRLIILTNVGNTSAVLEMARFRQQPVRLGLRSPPLKSDELRKSALPSG